MYGTVGGKTASINVLKFDLLQLEIVLRDSCILSKVAIFTVLGRQQRDVGICDRERGRERWRYLGQLIS